MTSSLPTTAPLAILQADHMGKITSEERVSLYVMEDDTESNLLPWWFTEILPPFLPLKTVTAEQNFQSQSWDMSPPSPQIASFSDWTIFPFYWHLPLDYWLLNYEQPNLSSVTLILHNKTKVIIFLLFLNFRVIFLCNNQVMFFNTIAALSHVS